MSPLVTPAPPGVPVCPACAGPDVALGRNLDTWMAAAGLKDALQTPARQDLSRLWDAAVESKQLRRQVRTTGTLRRQAALLFCGAGWGAGGAQLMAFPLAVGVPPADARPAGS